MLSTPKAKAELYLASSLYDGLEDNNIVQVTTLLLNKEADPNVLIPSQGITPFHLVIGNDSETFAEEVTKLFLRYGGNPNVKSTDGMTPVHVAAAWGRLGVLELLLSNGGDPLLVDDDGRSPFHYAFDEAHYEAIAVLGKYCGETFEDSATPKYNIVLDKVLVSNGDVVAEYVVSKETSSTIAANLADFCTSDILNNDDNLLGNKLGKLYDDSTNANNCGSERAAGPEHIDLTTTTTTDESSISLRKSSNVNRRRRCLPRKKIRNIEPVPSNECKIESKEVGENIASEIVSTKFSVSHLNDAAIEASFVVTPRGAGENMPRISSPKAGNNLVKSEYETVKELRDTETAKIGTTGNKAVSAKRKIVHKTPLRCRPSSKSRIKTPSTITTTEKRANFNGKTTPKNREPSSNDKRTLAFRTPNKFISKQNLYSPDCSIISKSPNLIVTPTTPTNARYRSKVERKVFTDGTDVFSARGSSKKTACTPSGITTPRKILNGGSGEKKFSRFVKQSDLRYRGVKKSPASSPNGRMNNSPSAWSKKYTRTPNLTDSVKNARKFPDVNRKIATTGSFSPHRSPATPLNKTYIKPEYSEAAVLSPDVECAARFIDRRTLAKSIAIKLEETRYDDDCSKNTLADDCIKNSEILKTENGTRYHSKDPDTARNEIPMAVDGRSNCRENINWDRANGNECNEPSTVKRDGKGEQRKGISFAGWYDPARASRIIAGFFQPEKANGGGSIATNATDEMPNVKLSDFPALINPGTFAKQLQTPNSKEVDDALISSDASGCSLDNDTRDTVDFPDSNYAGALTNLTNNPETYPGQSEKSCAGLPDDLLSTGGSSQTSFVSVEEEYKYEDAEQGVVLLERRLLVTPVSIPITKSEDRISYSSGISSACLEDKSVESRVSSLPQSLVFMDSEMLRRELARFGGYPPGPITATTRRVYLRRLWSLQRQGPVPRPLAIAAPSRFSAEVERSLRSVLWMNDLTSYEMLEREAFCEFARPNPRLQWREGTSKSSFSYLLLDPRITDNLPRHGNALSSIARWRTFLSSIFYIGKGTRSRPYAHLREACREWRNGGENRTNERKIERIIDIWEEGYGVVCLKLFQNTIPEEAYTREAAMIEALGLEKLTNSRAGDYYSVAASWSNQDKQKLGLSLLYKAMHIFMNEGERQLYPSDIGR